MIREAVRIGLTGLALTGCTQMEVRKVEGGCVAVIQEIGDRMDDIDPTYHGAAYPDPNGNTLIYVRDMDGKIPYLKDSVPGDLLNHELGHAVQNCVDKGQAVVRYASNPGKHERAADQYAIEHRKK